MIPYFYTFVEYFFIVYFLLFNTINLFYLVIAFYDVRRRVMGRGYEGFDIAMKSPFTPPLSILVPAYNEDKTIVESIKSLLRLRFPRLEIVIINDGSSDNTLEVLIEAFQMKRIDMNYVEKISTARVKAYYVSQGDLPDHIQRFVVLDKENGGKADALNAGINASFCPYFVSIDADSIIDEAALLQAFRSVLDQQDIVAIGGQVAIVNSSDVENGAVLEPRLSRKWIVRFQIVEYIRSFSMGRTALSRLQSILIISGVFGIFNKDFVQKTGGYLTRFLSSKIAAEYTGHHVETVCEDMEIIVRMQRYIKEKKLSKRITYVPHPLAWTEAPEDLGSLSKQRNRWQRGLIETMIYHRKMLFNRKYGRIGFFAFPYFFIFELLGAPIELLGYITLPILFVLDNLNFLYLILFTAVSIVYGIFLSVLSVVMSAWPVKTAETDIEGKSLIYFKGIKEIIILVTAAIFENLGYRQLTVWWRIKGIVDFFKGKKGWEKFDRKGFGTEANKEDKNAVTAA
ncbi:MAG: glycosyltransferase family 2 protein [Nitrospiraceae bacterium]|nr:MAG: glycosyltransferase family 2 protein [Nitrospiraceae bacterium]